jgi:hypothetical protein
MTQTPQRQAVLEALKVLSMRDAPADVLALARATSGLGEEALPISALENELAKAFPADPLVGALGELIARWDAYEGGAPWHGNSVPFTSERRQAVCHSLGLTEGAAQRMAQLRPILHSRRGLTTVSEPFRRWYSPSRVAGHAFYWPQYSRHLRETKGWSTETIDLLNVATDRVVERLADPLSEDTRSQRGLVVGFVQSGKTANYSGVIAKAIDAGYRLVIVLTGMHEALRRQTQRRLDMEVLGKPNILLDRSELEAIGSAQGEYLDDPQWASGFNDFKGERPRPEVERLTSYSLDFNKHRVSGLRFKAADDHVPLFSEERLFGLSARIAVVKKNADVLDHLLTAMRANKRSMLEVPTLIIDDESDQASVNTAKPSWRSKSDLTESQEDAKVRKRINKAISEMLSLMPRAQYVGYTATPFANVFIDPSDLHDLFPRDFLIALDEPVDYMGSSSFFNAVAPTDAPYLLTNKQAYIRELKATDRDLSAQDAEMQGALATYVVTGAIKLWREAHQPALAASFRHHTMLVHEATGKRSHTALAQRIVDVWSSAAWSSKRGDRLLRSAFDDLRPTLEDRQQGGIPFTDDYEDVRPFVSQVLARVETMPIDGGRAKSNCVLIVNSDTEVEKKLDFDHHATWKVVVGGAMLSRGFTIEGLTVSYFRRSPRAQDTLLQMGRWFGYRPGYRDLVRVYLATNTSISKTKNVNLYQAFESIALSEARFRQQLAEYAAWDGDQPAITPRQVRPLVLQSLPWLKPTSPVKMYNAKIARQREAVFSPKALPGDKGHVAQNWKKVRPLIRAADHHVDLGLQDARTVPAWVGVASVDQVVRALRETTYMDNYKDLVVRPRLAYYEHAHSEGILQDFLIVLPQLVSRAQRASNVRLTGNSGTRTGVKRKRDAQEYFGEFTDPSHRAIALALTRQDGTALTAASEALRSPQRGVVLAYFIPQGELPADGVPLDVSPTECVVGLTVYLPQTAASSDAGAPIVFEAMDSSQPD